MTAAIAWEVTMSQPNMRERDESPLVYDRYTKEFFEFILPELARSVKEYYPAGPGAIRFMTGDGHSFHFSITSRINPDPYMIEWKLVCNKGLYTRTTKPSFD